MKFTISEVFCEIVSAFGFIAAFFPILLLLNLVSLSDVAEWITSFTGTKLVSITFVAYILGVLLNAVGLPADRLMERLGITGQYPGDSSSKKFYDEASSDLFNFRTNNWNHYYCFRNLLIFTPFGLGLWMPIVYIHGGLRAVITFVVLIGAIGWLLYLAAKEHADLYSEITKAFD